MVVTYTKPSVILLEVVSLSPALKLSLWHVALDVGSWPLVRAYLKPLMIGQSSASAPE